MAILGANNFKIYIPTLDEENLIGYTIAALLKVFPPEMIEVIDLESDDSTISRIPKGIKVHVEPLPKNVLSRVARRAFTDIKNKYTKKQEWVLWVDGDEVYPTHVLRQMRAWLEAAIAGEHDKKCLRVYWKILDQREDGLYISKEYLAAGPKLFNSNYFGFRRSWPEEVIEALTDEYNSGDKWEFNGIWFYHGVLLQRSHLEKTVRRKKAVAKRTKYLKYLTFEKMTKSPWTFEATTPKKWELLNMVEGSEDKKWAGEL